MSYFLCPHPFFSRSSIRFETPKCLFLCPLHHREFGSITPTQKLDWWHKIGILRVADQQARTGQAQERSCTVPPCRTDLCATFLHEIAGTQFAVLPRQHNVKMLFSFICCVASKSLIIALDVISVCKPGPIYNYAFFLVSSRCHWDKMERVGVLGLFCRIFLN